MEKIKGYGRHSINEQDIASVVSVLQGDTLTQGPAVTRFEEKLSAYLGCERAVAVANGTAGLHLAALALGIGPGDAVILPGLTFAATANSIVYAGAVPVFADVSPHTWGLDFESVKAAYQMAKSHGLTPKAIFPVHFGGLPVDMSYLANFAREEGLYIVEDACHALGAEYRLDGSQEFVSVGSAKFTDIAVFSFHPVKHITTGEGGAVTTCSHELAHKLDMLRTHGITRNPDLFQVPSEAFATDSGKVNPWYMEMQELGFNYRMCDIQAALGASQMDRAASFLKSRKLLASHYRQGISSLKNVFPQSGDYEYGRHGYHLFPVRINFERLGTSRATLMAKLFDKGVPTQVHYLPVFMHPYYRNNTKKWLSVGCPETANIYKETLSIPMYQDLSLEQIDYVLNHLDKLIG
jgi:dTDP-4-amino-4,6-dideoxygalactose transaminase